jgi:hypothetical protein
MSILVWRQWTIRSKENSLFSNKYALYGHYNTPWLPGEVKQADCNEYVPGSPAASPVINYAYTYTLTLSTTTTNTYLMTEPNLTITTVNRTPKHERDEVPYERCTCGIYGFKRYFPPPHCECELHKMIVLGIAEIWGKIITADYGYRAQYAKIRALVRSPAYVAADYSVPNLPSIEYAQEEFFTQ